MDTRLGGVVVVDAVLTASPLQPRHVEDIVWGVTNQVKEQGGTLGRLISMTDSRSSQKRWPTVMRF